MTPRRRLLLLVAMVLSVTLALAARDLVHQLVVLPLSYVIWQVGVLLAAVPALAWWAVLVVLAALVVGRELVPEIRRSAGRVRAHPQQNSQIRTMALSLQRARRSAYFKWQVANRLSRVSRRLTDIFGSELQADPLHARISKYLKAGIDGSFVDYAVRRPFVIGGSTSPLDISPLEAVEYLESYLDAGRARRADGQ